MRHINIKRVTSFIFIDDSNFVEITYEDSKRNNIDKFVLKNTVDGISKSKSFVVGDNKYHIHDDKSEADKLQESLKRYNKTLKSNIANMKDDFILRGTCVNPVKKYIGTKLLTGISAVDEVIESGGYTSDNITYGDKKGVVYGGIATRPLSYDAEVIKFSTKPSRNGVVITDSEIELMMTNSGIKNRMINEKDMEDYFIQARKEVKRKVNYDDLDIDTAFWKYFEARGMRLRKEEEK